MAGSYFTHEFVSFLERQRRYHQPGVSHRVLATSAGLGRSTVNAAFAGSHIRPEPFGALARIVTRHPLEKMELNVRYVEADLHRYLVSDTEWEEGAVAAAIPNFFRSRAESVRTPGERLAAFFQGRFERAGMSPLESHQLSCRRKHRKLPSYATVTALVRGVHVRWRSFAKTCDALQLSEPDMTIARILFAESLLGESLLGAEMSVFAENLDGFPRVVSVLSFSVTHWSELA